MNNKLQLIAAAFLCLSSWFFTDAAAFCQRCVGTSGPIYPFPIMHCGDGTNLWCQSDDYTYCASGGACDYGDCEGACWDDWGSCPGGDCWGWCPGGNCETCAGGDLRCYDVGASYQFEKNRKMLACLDKRLANGNMAFLRPAVLSNTNGSYITVANVQTPKPQEKILLTVPDGLIRDIATYHPRIAKTVHHLSALSKRSGIPFASGEYLTSDAVITAADVNAALSGQDNKVVGQHFVYYTYFFHVMNDELFLGISPHLVSPSDPRTKGFVIHFTIKGQDDFGRLVYAADRFNAL